MPKSICGNMKRDGIEIFTIGFDLNDPTMTATERDQAKSVLKDCATPDTSSLKHYYEAATGAELEQAFDEIIRNIETLTIIALSRRLRRSSQKEKAAASCEAGGLPCFRPWRGPWRRPLGSPAAHLAP